MIGPASPSWGAPVYTKQHCCCHAGPAACHGTQLAALCPSTVLYGSVCLQTAACFLMLKPSRHRSRAKAGERGWALLDSITGRPQGEPVIEEAHGKQGHKHDCHADDENDAALRNLRGHAVSILQPLFEQQMHSRPQAWAGHTVQLFPRYRKRKMLMNGPTHEDSS